MEVLHFVALCIASLLLADAHQLTKLGSFHLGSPAFSGFYKAPSSGGTGDKYNLIVTTFGPSLFSSIDSVQVVKDIGNHLNDIGSLVPEVVTRSVTWPNEVTDVPDGIFPHKMLVIPDGFLVPLKTKGSISFMDVSSTPYQGPYTVTRKSGGDWFYHRVLWQDMDGDGDLDIVTCRAREPAVPIIFGREDEQLIWLENPSGNYKTTWNAHVLAHGPDSFFTYASLNTSEGLKECIIAAQFFTKSLTVYWTTQANGHYTDASKIQHRVIDDTIGAVFEVEVVDVNNDGKLDLLVSTNGNNGTVLVYEIPDDFRTGIYVKHVIAVGFKPRSLGIGKGAPGNVFAAQPNAAVKGQKPVIFLSGDDDGRAYMFEATSQDTHDWGYTKTTILDAGSGTVGDVSVADVNGDGFLEVVIPAYNRNEVNMFTFAPHAPVIG